MGHATAASTVTGAPSSKLVSVMLSLPLRIRPPLFACSRYRMPSP
jgi:hypothetical protein